MRNIVILNSLHFSYPLPILMRVSYNTLIVKQNTSDYYKYSKKLQKNNTYLTQWQLFQSAAVLPHQEAQHDTPPYQSRFYSNQNNEYCCCTLYDNK